MSRPEKAFVTLATGPRVAEQLLDELFARPRRAVFTWSRKTGQTAQVRLAYPGQHLASIITGVSGRGTAARGVDLADGSEVKSCSRADQLGSCKDCGSGILPYQDECPACGSEALIRKTDSHWILSIKSKAELKQYLDAPRILLILFDRDDDQSTVRVRAWEVWPHEPRHEYFAWFVTDYFKNNYQAKTSDGLVPAPLNLHPLKFDFYMMNPVLVFAASILDADTEKSSVRIDRLTGPLKDRAKLPSEPMPAAAVRPRSRLLKLVNLMDERAIVRCTESKLTIRQASELKATKIGRLQIARSLKSLDEETRLQVTRPVKRIKRTPSTYRRRV